MKARYLVDLSRARRLDNVGNKARGLTFLHKKGFAVPKTHVCTWDAYTRYVQGDPAVLEGIRAKLAQRLQPGRSYVVRSSANVEDASVHSFAGQFLSVLDVQGESEVVQALLQVWSHVRSPSLQTYLKQVGLSVDAIKMAVLVQERVTPVVSGISFSKNPLTGMDEVIVEAVHGSGEALAQNGAQPHRWVNKWGAWIDPEGSQPQEEGVDLALIEQVVQQTRSIAKAYGRPVDLEWVWDGETLYWVQLREITALNVDIYSNRISQEVFPGLIKPLVWSVNVPLVNGAWSKLFTELIGPNDIDPNDLAKSFYYRAYFNMGAIGRIFEMLGFPRESLELLMGIEVEGGGKPSFKPTSKTWMLLPRMLAVAIRKLGFARRVEAFLPAARARYKALKLDLLARTGLDSKALDALDARGLLKQIDDLYDLTQRTAYFNIVTPLLMQLYNSLLKGQLERSGVEFESLDFTQGLPELEQYDPNPHLAALHQAYHALAPEVQNRIRQGGAAVLNSLPGIDVFRSGMERFIRQFGHLSDSGNDFSSIPWRETPDLVLEMAIHYTAPELGTETRSCFQDVRLPAVKRGLGRFLYRRAGQFRLYREAVSSLYTYGYGLFRNCFMALGERLAGQGLVQSQEDILYLRLDEIRNLVETCEPADYQQTIVQRKKEMERCRSITPPGIIYGDQPPPVQTHVSDRLTGIPTSRGLYRGPVRVVQGIRDLDKVQEGDVLVVPYADVGWTPLFTRAGAVIAESGGILSHSSIVAREYGIPAVVSVPGACSMSDGTIVSVDGYRGEIVLQQAVQDKILEFEPEFSTHLKDMERE